MYPLKYEKHYKEFIKFAIVGSTSTAVNYAVFYYLFHFDHFNYLVASASGFITGMFISYTLNRKFTFESENQKRAKEFFSYFAVCLFSLGLSLLTLRFCVEILHISPLLGNLFAIGVSTVSNFLGAKFFVFKK